VQLQVSEDGRFLIVREASEIELEQLRISLTRKIKNWRFNPRVQQGYWDGSYCYLINNQFIPSGLWREVYDIAKKYKYDIQFDGIRNLFDQSIDRADFEKWSADFFDGYQVEGVDIRPRDYQLDTAFKILKFKKCSAELATSAGKTMIAFMTVAYMLQRNLAKKILFIVPTVDLVIQGTDDFHEFNWQQAVKLKVQQVYAGQKIKPDVNIVFGTYQSLVKKKADYYAEFDAVIVDEMHKVKSHSIKSILEKCVNAQYRFGLTGTMPKPETLERLTSMCYTGPLISEIGAKYLQDQGHIAQCQVKVLQMDYATHETKQAFLELSRNRYERKKVFSLEQNYIINHQERLDFITKVIGKSTKNSLILFYRIDYGEAIYNKLRSSLDNKSVYYVDGGTDNEIRDLYKKKMEAQDDVLLVASFGTFSTGISVKNIHNIFFCESFKSEVIIRQSIGRGLRQHKNKDMLTIVDFVDDFRTDGWDNYIYKHGQERIKIYKDQQFPYSIHRINF